MESERMDSNHQDLVYDQDVPSYLHIPNNPDSRVSKVFNVSCACHELFRAPVRPFTFYKEVPLLSMRASKSYRQ